MKIIAFRRTMLLLSTAMPVTAQARQAAPAPAAASATPVAPDQGDIIITGARPQAVREIEAKREIAVISDSISADEIVDRRRSVPLWGT